MASRVTLALLLAAEVGCAEDLLIGADHGPKTHRGELEPLGGPCDIGSDTADESACGDCSACATSERCTTETAQCDAHAGCAKLDACLDGCASAGCAEQCYADWNEGVPFLEAIEDCVQCECMSACGLTEACLGL